MDRFRRILYVERRSPGSRRGLSRAREVARTHGAELTVAGAGTRARRGDPAGAILREVTRGRHDLLMKVAGPRRPPRPWRLDSLDRRLLREAPCPVWILDPAQGETVGVVLAALDVADGATDGARHVLRAARCVADGSGAELHVVHAWSLVGEPILSGYLTGVSRRRLRGLLASTRRERRRRVEELLAEEAPDRPARVELRKGDPVRAVHDVACDLEADVVVLGAPERTGLARLLLGNVAERILGRVPASILVVRRTPSPAAAARDGPRGADTDAVPAGA